MDRFIKVCDSIYGASSCIYRFVNPNQIVELHVSQSQYEVNVEALLTSGQRVIILKSQDIIDLIGEDYTREILEEIKEIINEHKDRTK